MQRNFIIKQFIILNINADTITLANANNKNEEILINKNYNDFCKIAPYNLPFKKRFLYKLDNIARNFKSKVNNIIIACC